MTMLNHFFMTFAKNHKVSPLVFESLQCQAQPYPSRVKDFTLEDMDLNQQSQICLKADLEIMLARVWNNLFTILIYQEFYILLWRIAIGWTSQIHGHATATSSDRVTNLNSIVLKKTESHKWDCDPMWFQHGIKGDTTYSTLKIYLKTCSSNI